MIHADRAGGNPAEPTMGEKKGGVTLSPMGDKRPRRTREAMNTIKEAMIAFARENCPLTVHQLFYLLVTAGVIDKSESEYKQTVIRLALELRRSKAIPWEWVVDRTRFFFKAKTFDSLSELLEEQARLYRRSLWTDADVNVQVWCESMSVAGIINSETNRWDVPLFPGRGYSSHDFLRTAAHDIADGGKDTMVYLLGDYDPSGRDIIRFVCKTLREYADEVDPSVRIDFQTVAVTEQQIAEWSLPGHPAKQSDSRQGRYKIAQAVELEAIRPAQLRQIVRDCITRHIDNAALGRLRTVESAERSTLRAIANGGGR